MRILYLLLVTCLCLASAKYLPHEARASRALLWSHERSISDESAVSQEEVSQDNNDSDSDDEDSDDGDSTGKKIKEENQRRLEKIEKERQKLSEKQEKERRKQEQKEVEQSSKTQEKILEDERKTQQRLEKEQRKLREQIEKGERKHQEAILKQHERAEKEKRKQNEDKSIEIEDIWRDHIYSKYGLTHANTKLEKKAALNRYLQQEVGIPANSTKTEKRQAILQHIQNKLQNDTSSQNELRTLIISYINTVGAQQVRSQLEQKIEKLENKTALLANIPFAMVANQEIAEKKNFLAAVSQIFSNIVPSWNSPGTQMNSTGVESNDPNVTNFGPSQVGGSPSSAPVNSGSFKTPNGATGITSPSTDTLTTDLQVAISDNSQKQKTENVNAASGTVVSLNGAEGVNIGNGAPDFSDNIGAGNSQVASPYEVTAGNGVNVGDSAPVTFNFGIPSIVENSASANSLYVPQNGGNNEAKSEVQSVSFQSPETLIPSQSNQDVVKEVVASVPIETTVFNNAGSNPLVTETVNGKALKPDINAKDSNGANGANTSASKIPASSTATENTDSFNLNNEATANAINAQSAPTKDVAFAETTTSNKAGSNPSVTNTANGNVVVEASKSEINAENTNGANGASTSASNTPASSTVTENTNSSKVNNEETVNVIITQSTLTEEVASVPVEITASNNAGSNPSMPETANGDVVVEASKPEINIENNNGAVGASTSASEIPASSTAIENIDISNLNTEATVNAIYTQSLTTQEVASVPIETKASNNARLNPSVTNTANGNVVVKASKPEINAKNSNGANGANTSASKIPASSSAITNIDNSNLNNEAMVNEIFIQSTLTEEVASVPVEITASNNAGSNPSMTETANGNVVVEASKPEINIENNNAVDGASISASNIPASSTVTESTDSSNLNNEVTVNAIIAQSPSTEEVFNNTGSNPSVTETVNDNVVVEALKPEINADNSNGANGASTSASNTPASSTVTENTNSSKVNNEETVNVIITQSTLTEEVASVPVEITASNNAGSNPSMPETANGDVVVEASKPEINIENNNGAVGASTRASEIPASSTAIENIDSSNLNTETTVNAIITQSLTTQEVASVPTETKASNNAGLNPSVTETVNGNVVVEVSKPEINAKNSNGANGANTSASKIPASSTAVENIDNYNLYNEATVNEIITQSTLTEEVASVPVEITASNNAGSNPSMTETANGNVVVEASKPEINIENNNGAVGASTSASEIPAFSTAIENIDSSNLNTEATANAIITQSTLTEEVASVPIESKVTNNAGSNPSVIETANGNVVVEASKPEVTTENSNTTDGASNSASNIPAGSNPSVTETANGNVVVEALKPEINTGNSNAADGASTSVSNNQASSTVTENTNSFSLNNVASVNTVIAQSPPTKEVASVPIGTTASNNVGSNPSVTETANGYVIIEASKPEINTEISFAGDGANSNGFNIPASSTVPENTDSSNPNNDATVNAITAQSSVTEVVSAPIKTTTSNNAGSNAAETQTKESAFENYLAVTTLPDKITQNVQAQNEQQLQTEVDMATDLNVSKQQQEVYAKGNVVTESAALFSRTSVTENVPELNRATALENTLVPVSDVTTDNIAGDTLNASPTEVPQVPVESITIPAEPGATILEITQQ